MSLTMSPDELQNLLAAAMKQAMTGIATQAQPVSPQPQPHSVPSFAIFEHSREKWAAYLQRLNQHIIAHGVVDADKKKAYFLSWVGPETYELINKLFSASELDEASFGDVTGKLDEHFKQSLHELAASYTFYQCNMKPGQTYGHWVADLRCIGRDCNFGASEVLDRLIRNMIVLNTPHNEVRRACLKEPSPTLDGVLKTANSYVALAASDAIVKGPTQGPTPEVLAVEKLRQPRRTKTGNWKNNKSHKSESRPEGRQGQRCAGCGSTNHRRAACPFLKSECHKCGRIGHIKSVCRSEQSGSKSHNDYKTASMLVMTLHTHTHTRTHARDLRRKSRQALLINGHNVEFEVDTGSPIALTGETGWKKIGSPRLARSYIRRCAYGQRQISVMGECTVDVKCGSTVLQLPLVVVSSGASLLGLNWIQAFQLDINALLYTPKASAELLSADVHTMGVPTDLDLKKVIADHPSIFAPGLGLCTKTKAHLQLRDDVQPKFLKARPLPFSRIDAVGKELQRLQDLKIVTKVDYSDWATPIVVVQKPSGKVMICGDYRATVNPCLHVQQHPIPRIEELFAKLQGGMHFSKLDMRDAYLQIELDDETKQLLVINTHKGLYRYNRLCFGPSPAPAIFQKLVDNLVAGIPGVAAYLDDIIVTGQTKAEHLENLRRVFAALDNYGLKLQLDKCVFFAPEVSYLGYIISKDGLCASEERVQAILQYATPTDLKQLESFVGKLNCYGQFLPAFASVCAPLNQLRCKDTPWKWSAECAAAFDELKQMLADKTRLVHFDPEKPIVLATDASPYGIGAVISHVLPDGSEEPIAFASKTLSKTERGYAQVEKEGLSIVYGIR